MYVTYMPFYYYWYSDADPACNAPTWSDDDASTYDNSTHVKTSTDPWGDEDGDCGYMLKIENIDDTNPVIFTVITNFGKHFYPSLITLGVGLELLLFAI
mmetsp:Transcript_3497/g.2513  ORF Transcript_3497/g.2513 Transcript_3497/m.2513 type:complete len:99 (-) Transcript_3497:1375-1671(-)